MEEESGRVFLPPKFIAQIQRVVPGARDLIEMMMNIDGVEGIPFNNLLVQVINTELGKNVPEDGRTRLERLAREQDLGGLYRTWADIAPECADPAG